MNHVSDALTLEDRARLHAYGIEDELIAAAGIRRVTHDEARDLGMSTRYGDLAGVVVPRLDPVTGHNRTWRLRRDHPQFGSDGRPEAKYLTPGNDRQCLFFVPGVGPLLSDGSVTVVLVESDWSALALHDAARRAGRQLLALGMGGCNGWRCRHAEKVTRPDGTRVDVSGPASDLSRINWTDRDVVVLLDANADTNPLVKHARRTLSGELARRGACVRIGTVPANSDVNGPDDYRAIHGDLALLALIDTARPASDDEAHEGRRGHSQATRLVDLAQEQMELWHAPDGKTYATFQNGGHHEHHPLERAVRNTLSLAYYRRYGGTPNNAALGDATVTLRGMALYDGPTHPVALRVAEKNGTVYLDLGDDDWRAVAIDASGWRVIQNPPVRFRRPASMRALPVPTSGGKLDAFRELWALDDDTWWLATIWLISALRPTGPYPVLVEIGEQGSGKSTLGRMLRGLVDPAWPELRGVPREERDVMIGAMASHVVALDNLSGLPVWLSDALCRVSTGGGLATRTLYTDVDETLIEVARPILLTGIDQPVTRGDLLDRALVMTLPTIRDEQRQNENDLWRRYRVIRPAVFGAMCDAVSTAIRRIDAIHLSRYPRMADAARWVTAAAPALDWPDKRVVDAIFGARERAAQEQVDNDALAVAICNLNLPWCGTKMALLAHLKTCAPDAVRSGRGFMNPVGLTAALTRLAPALRHVGIDVQKSGREGHARNRVFWIVRIVRDMESPLILSAPSGTTGADNSPGPDDSSSAVVRAVSAVSAANGGIAADADDADNSMHRSSAPVRSGDDRSSVEVIEL